MTEHEWLACPDPLRMLQHIDAEPNTRKPLLLAIACLNRLGERLPEACRLWLRDAEAVAEGLASLDRIDVHYEAAEWQLDELATVDEPGEIAAIQSILFPGWTDPIYADSVRSDNLPGLAAEQAAQAALVREIFGNPFRPVGVGPSWRTPAVLSLARTIYDEQLFVRMPEIAEALEREGYGNSEVLSHCRNPAQHVRGCWVVDLLLGKS